MDFPWMAWQAVLYFVAGREVLFASRRCLWARLHSNEMISVVMFTLLNYSGRHYIHT
jgi:hypothetical protein